MEGGLRSSESNQLRKAGLKGGWDIHEKEMAKDVLRDISESVALTEAKFIVPRLLREG